MASLPVTPLLNRTNLNKHIPVSYANNRPPHTHIILPFMPIEWEAECNKLEDVLEDVDTEGWGQG